MNLFKKAKSVWALRGARVPEGTRGATLARTESAKWHVSVDRRHVPLHPNREIAEEMAAQLLARRAAGRLGVVVASKDDDRRKALPALVGEWAAALRLKGTGGPHVELLKARVDRVLAGCGFARVRDLSGGAAYQFVGGLNARPGPGRPASRQTRHFYLAALRQFARFPVRRKALHDNPSDDLEPWDVRKDRRHDRRELTGGKLGALTPTTGRGGVTRSEPTAGDRAMQYRAAVSTGPRAGELGSLRPDNFDLANAEVTVPGGFTESGEPAVQPLPPALVPVLGGWLEGEPRGQHCWPGRWAESRAAGKVLRRDLGAAGVPSVGGGLHADSHALRHSDIPRLIRGGVDLKVAQALARHSTITLTADRYGHLAHGEKRAAKPLEREASRAAVRRP